MIIVRGGVTCVVCLGFVLLLVPHHQYLSLVPHHQYLYVVPHHQYLSLVPHHQYLSVVPHHQYLSLVPHHQYLSMVPHHQYLSVVPHHQYLPLVRCQCYTVSWREPEITHSLSSQRWVPLSFMQIVWLVDIVVSFWVGETYLPHRSAQVHSLPDIFSAYHGRQAQGICHGYHPVWWLSICWHTQHPSVWKVSQRWWNMCGIHVCTNPVPALPHTRIQGNWRLVNSCHTHFVVWHC